MKQKISDGGLLFINGVEVGTFSDLYFEPKEESNKKHDDEVEALSYTVIE